MYPNYFKKREQELLGNRFDALYTAPNAVAARGVTVNGLRCTQQAFSKLADFPLEPSPFCKNAFAVLLQEFKPGRHAYHHAGAFYSQEPSAAAPAGLLDVQPGMKVLDLCAAPGGKTSQLAAALQGQGVLVCNEYEPQRAEILKSNLERMGVCNAVITQGDTALLAKAFPAFFDRVLVDAPCSGEGMFRKEAQAVTQHSPQLVEQCAQLGAQILENAAACLAPGGIMVYSTCTFAPQEDETQVGRFLALHPEFELLPCGDAFGSPGEANRCGEYSLATEKLCRIWPCQGGEGHFMAKLQKQGQPIAPLRTKPQKPPKAPQEWLEFARRYFPELEGKTLLKAGELWLLPPDESLPIAKLRVLRCGTALGTVQKKRFEPAHHLFMAFGAVCTNREQLTLNDARTAAWLRGEEIEAKTAENGWCSVLVDGFPLGGGKVSGGRVKNHYPKALRNLK